MLANQTVGISRVTRPRENRCFHRLLLSMAIIFATPPPRAVNRNEGQKATCDDGA